jgi:hypothetical protein
MNTMFIEYRSEALGCSWRADVRSFSSKYDQNAVVENSGCYWVTADLKLNGLTLLTAAESSLWIKRNNQEVTFWRPMCMFETDNLNTCRSRRTLPVYKQKDITDETSSMNYLSWGVPPAPRVRSLPPLCNPNAADSRSLLFIPAS